MVKFRDVEADMLGRIKSASAAARRTDSDDAEADSDDEDVVEESASEPRAERAMLPSTAVAMNSARASMLLRDMVSDKPLVAPPPAAVTSASVSQAAEKKRKHRDVDWDAF